MDAVLPFQRPPPKPSPALLPLAPAAPPRALFLVMVLLSTMRTVAAPGFDEWVDAAPLYMPPPKPSPPVAATTASPPWARLRVTVLLAMLNTPPRRFAIPPPSPSPPSPPIAWLLATVLFC